MLKKGEKSTSSGKLSKTVRGSGQSKSCYNIHELARSGTKPSLESYLSSLNVQEQQNEIEARNFSGSTPLQIAAYYGNQSILTALEAKGADKKTSNLFGWSARHYAARLSQPLDVQLTVGLKPRAPTLNSKTFSFSKLGSLAAKKKNSDLSKLNLESGISIRN